MDSFTRSIVTLMYICVVAVGKATETSMIFRLFHWIVSCRPVRPSANGGKLALPARVVS